jgi:hypothetical protein
MCHYRYERFTAPTEEKSMHQNFCIFSRHLKEYLTLKHKQKRDFKRMLLWNVTRL